MVLFILSRKKELLCYNIPLHLLSCSAFNSPGKLHHDLQESNFKTPSAGLAPRASAFHTKLPVFTGILSGNFHSSAEKRNWGEKITSIAYVCTCQCICLWSVDFIWTLNQNPNGRLTGSLLIQWFSSIFIVNALWQLVPNLTGLCCPDVHISMRTNFDFYQIQILQYANISNLSYSCGNNMQHNMTGVELNWTGVWERSEVPYKFFVSNSYWIKNVKLPTIHYCKIHGKAHMILCRDKNKNIKKCKN